MGAPHFELVWAASRKIKWLQDEKVRVEHVPFGVVLGEDKKKFKTRSGETVKLKSLLDEGQDRVGKLMEERKKDDAKKNVDFDQEEWDHTKHAVAISSIKY